MTSAVFIRKHFLKAKFQKDVDVQYKRVYIVQNKRYVDCTVRILWLFVDVLQ